MGDLRSTQIFYRIEQPPYIPGRKAEALRFIGYKGQEKFHRQYENTRAIGGKRQGTGGALPVKTIHALENIRNEHLLRVERLIAGMKCDTREIRISSSIDAARV